MLSTNCTKCEIEQAQPQQRKSTDDDHWQWWITYEHTFDSRHWAFLVFFIKILEMPVYHLCDVVVETPQIRTF